MSDEHSEEFLRGYQRALGDAGIALQILDRSWRERSNHPSQNAFVSDLLRLAERTVTALEPGFVSPATGDPRGV